MLTVHLWIGVLAVALAILAVWRRPGRRVTLYVVTLQILIGIALLIMGYRVSPLHMLAVLIGWAGYMAANAVAKRSNGARNALIIAGVSSLLILAAFELGRHAVAHPAA